MPHDATRGPRDPHRGPTQGTHTGTQTGDPHRGEDPAEDPPPEGRATQGTHTGHTQTVVEVVVVVGLGVNPTTILTIIIMLAPGRPRGPLGQGTLGFGFGLTVESTEGISEIWNGA